jgi:hypothetical protein
VVDGRRGSVEGRRVTGRESTAFAWVYKNRIAPELIQIQSFSLYRDSAKCNLDENTKAAWVHTCYKCIAQKVNLVPLSDGCIPDAGLDWRGRVVNSQILPQGTWRKVDNKKITRATDRDRNGAKDKGSPPEYAIE